MFSFKKGVQIHLVDISKFKPNLSSVEMHPADQILFSMEVL